MSEVVPEDRIRGKLGELLPLKYGKSLSAATRDASGSVPVFGSSGIVGRHSSALTTGPTIIVGRKGNVGAVHFSAVPCWPIDTAYFVEPLAGHSAAYYRYLLTSLNLVRLDKSTAIPGLSRDDYNAVEVAVHAPAQQLEIAAELEKQFSRLDEAVANLQRVKANLKRYKASVLKAGVEGRLVETEATLARREGRDYETGEALLQRILEEMRANWAGKRKYREPVKPETEALSELPEGWVWASPEQVSAGEPYSLAIGPFGSSLKVSDYKTEGVPLVFVRNIRSGVFGGEKTVYVTADKAVELSAHSVESGDILVTKMGDPPGDVCRYPANRPPAVITADCIKLRVAKLGIDPAFIEYAMASRIVQDQILGITKGVAQLKVNLANFSSIALPVPPHAEQARIVDEVDRHLSILREVETEVDANLQRAQALRQSVLQRAFSTGSPNADDLQPPR